MLALLVSTPRLRSRARELLASDTLADEQHRRIASIVAEAGEAVSPGDLMGQLEERVPGSAELLSSAVMQQEEDADADALADDLTRRLKELELERRIAVGKAKLKAPETLQEPGEYDRLFVETSSLQRELDALRRSSSEA